MLPSIKLPPSLTRSHDAVPGAAIPVPEEAGASDGIFADKLRIRIDERDSDGGNALPLLGTELPALTVLAAGIRSTNASLPPQSPDPGVALPAAHAPIPTLKPAVDAARIAGRPGGAILTMPTSLDFMTGTPEASKKETPAPQNLEFPAMRRADLAANVATRVTPLGSALPLVATPGGHASDISTGTPQPPDSVAGSLRPGVAILERGNADGHRRDAGAVAGNFADSKVVLQASFELEAARRPGETDLGRTRGPGNQLFPESRPVAAPAAEARPRVSADVVGQRQSMRTPGVSGDPVSKQDGIVRQDTPAAQKALAKQASQAGAIEIEPAPLAATATRAGTDPKLLAPMPAVSRAIEMPVLQPGWDKAMSERVLLMANSKLQNAEIRLMPRELGPLRIELTLDDGVANVSFHAQHAITRDAIELALPRLRDMLADQGLSLGQASVGEDGVERETRDTGGAPGRNERASGDDPAIDESRARAPNVRTGDGLVDTFV